MTTFTQARAELETALSGIGKGVTSDPGGIEPPYTFIAAAGADVTNIIMGKMPSTWRLVLVAGGWGDAGTAALLDGLKQNVLTVMRGLADWQLEALGNDAMRSFAGSDYLTAELRCVRMVDI